MEKKRQIAAVLILLALIGVIAYRHSTGKDLEKYEHLFLMCLTHRHRSMYSYVRLSIDRCTATYV